MAADDSKRRLTDLDEVPAGTQVRRSGKGPQHACSVLHFNALAQVRWGSEGESEAPKDPGIRDPLQLDAQLGKDGVPPRRGFIGIHVHD